MIVCAAGPARRILLHNARAGKASRTRESMPAAHPQEPERSMQRIDLAKNETTRLGDAYRTRIDCVDGVAWVTIDRDSRDVVLTRGQSFVVDRNEDVIVCAIQGRATVELQRPGRVLPFPVQAARRPSARPSWPAWLRGVSGAA
jgi:hypothetical protein